MQNMENIEPFYYILKDTISTKVIRMMAPWLAQGKLEILPEILSEWLLYQWLRYLQNVVAAATTRIS